MKISKCEEIQSIKDILAQHSETVNEFQTKRYFYGYLNKIGGSPDITHMETQDFLCGIDVAPLCIGTMQQELYHQHVYNHYDIEVMDREVDLSHPSSIFSYLETDIHKNY